MGDAQLPGTLQASLNPAVLAFTLRARDPHRPGLRRHPGAGDHARQRRGISEGRQPQRHRQPEHRGGPHGPGRRRDDVRRDAADRRRPAAQELRQAAERESRVLRRERPDGADRAAGLALSGCRRATARSGRGCSSRRARCRASPSAASTTNVPFNGNVSSGPYTIVGRAQGPGEALPHGRQEVVGGDYFKAMHIPLLAGRFVQRRRHHRRAAPSASSTSTWRRSTSRRGERRWPADPARRTDEPASRSSASSAPSTASISASR